MRAQGSGVQVTKPCVCQLGIRVGIYKPTGKVGVDGKREFICRLCGRTEWRS